MRKTEASFGLVRICGRISADNGATYLPGFAEMPDAKFNELIHDIEAWKEERMTLSDIQDLAEILDV